MILLIIIIILLIIYFLWNKNIVKEHFSFPDLYVPNPFGNEEEVFNSGYGEEWYIEPESSNIKQDLLSNYAINNTDNVILPVSLNYTNRKYRMGILDIDDTFKNNINTKTPNLQKHLKNLVEIINENQKLKIVKDNLLTWPNRYKDYDPNDFNIFIKPKSKQFLENNKILNLFLKKFNKYQESILTKYQLVYFGKEDYNIYSYKIQKLEKNSLNEYIFSIIVILFREGITFCPVLYFQSFVNNNGKVEIYNFNIMGYMMTEKLLIPNGKNKDNNEFILNDYYNLNHGNNNILQLDIFQTYDKITEKIQSYKLDNQYVCMTTNADDIINPKVDSKLILPASDKNICESNYNFFGQRKQTGVWDTPCKNDSDCFFYQSNKNYPNSFGKCKSDGYCELPLNMVNIGYRYYIDSKTTKPLCYNCEPSDKWSPVTNIDTCCDEQYDKKKYPNLNGPDYVFKDDKIDRINYNNFLNYKLKQIQ